MKASVINDPRIRVLALKIFSKFFKVGYATDTHYTCKILTATAGLPLLASDLSLSINTDGSVDTNNLSLSSMDMDTPVQSWSYDSQSTPAKHLNTSHCMFFTIPQTNLKTTHIILKPLT